MTHAQAYPIERHRRDRRFSRAYGLAVLLDGW
jgi:hypothetical protein